MGRFIGPRNLSYVQNIMMMKPFESSVECDGVFDVYYYQQHERQGDYSEGSGCHATGKNSFYSYGCILKLVPLDKNGNRIQRKGVNTELVSIYGAAKGAYGYAVSRVRLFDTQTHELVRTISAGNVGNPELNPHKWGAVAGSDIKNTDDSPFWRAAYNSDCPIKPDPNAGT